MIDILYENYKEAKENYLLRLKQFEDVNSSDPVAFEIACLKLKSAELYLEACRKEYALALQNEQHVF